MNHITSKRDSGLTRRQALVVVGGITGALYSKQVGIGAQGRQMFLALDDVQEIVFRYRGRQVSINPAAVLEALAGGKGA